MLYQYLLTFMSVVVRSQQRVLILLTYKIAKGKKNCNESSYKFKNYKISLIKIIFIALIFRALKLMLYFHTHIFKSHQYWY